MKYKVGDKVEIIRCLYCHGFEIGEVVVIEEAREWNNDYISGLWALREDEIELAETN